MQHVRIKVPESRAPRTDEGYVKFGATPWHQDQGVITEEADETDMLTVWFPLLDAGIENGCLQVLPGTHKGGLLTPLPRRPGPLGVEIPERTLARDGSRAMPMKRGDILLLNQRTAHAALPNVSDEVRWSFDLRYPRHRPADRPAVIPRLRRPQPLQPGLRAARPGLLARLVAGGPRPTSPPRSTRPTTAGTRTIQPARDS